MTRDEKVARLAALQAERDSIWTPALRKQHQERCDRYCSCLGTTKEARVTEIYEEMCGLQNNR